MPITPATALTKSKESTMPEAALKIITNRVDETPPENPDRLLLLVCGHWRKARAEHELALAVHKLALLENPDLDFDEIEAYRRMKDTEERFQLPDDCVPETIVGAAEMLRIAATILSHPNKDDVGMGEGPILDIVKRVADGLERIEARRHGLKGFDGLPI
jgi:hypothetical protein